jgi:uncharacterized membrane protein (Fun14 family)
MRALTLVGSALGLAGAVAATNHLVIGPQEAGDRAALSGRPPSETFLTDTERGMFTPPTAEAALPFPSPAERGGYVVEPAFFSPENLLNLGFSFIVGLAVGYAFKIAFKVALVGGGLLLIALFALQNAGLIGINWVGMEAGYDSFAAWFGAYAGALKDFMTQHLSNAAAFGAGLLLGLKL